MKPHGVPPTPEESALERRARELLEESVANLPASTRSQLTQARHAALLKGLRDARRDAVAGNPAWRAWRTFAPAGAIAAAALVGLLLLTRGVDEPLAPFAPAGPAGPRLEDLDLIVDAEGLELADLGDPAFLEWAAAAGDDAARPGQGG